MAGPLAPLPPLCSGLTRNLMRLQLDKHRSHTAGTQALGGSTFFRSYVHRDSIHEPKRGKDR
jgi:hypothetical protein